jgi:uncharacterized protein (TIGR02598 family)
VLFPQPLPVNVTQSESRPRSLGFSLIEVAISLGIVAFAFVALLGVMPSGLSSFRTAIDNSNESWIMQGMNSMIQVTEWQKIKDLESETYYYNEEGRMTDTKAKPSTDERVKASRLYAVRVIIDEKFSRPDGVSDVLKHSARVIVLLAAVSNPMAMADFEQTETVEAVGRLKPSSQVRARAFLVARMDSVK